MACGLCPDSQDACAGCLAAARAERDQAVRELEAYRRALSRIHVAADRVAAYRPDHAEPWQAVCRALADADDMIATARGLR